MSDAQKPLLSLIVPAYNEASRLPQFFAAFEAYYRAHQNHAVLKRSEWIFVDDGSKDETAEVLDAWINARRFEWKLKVLRLNPNQGKGGAVRAGDSASNSPVRCFLDADLSTPLEKILPAYDRFLGENADLAIGSRHCAGARLVEKQPWHRILLGRLFSYFCSLFHANAFTDTQCGFKLWNDSFSKDIVQKLEERRWAFDLEMILRAESAGKTIIEEPVTWTDVAGSKVSPLSDGFKMLAATLRFRAKYGSLWIWLLAAVILIACFSMAMRWSNDMSTYAIAWEHVREGRLNEIYEVARKGQGGYYYSPFFALVGAPLSLLSTPPLRFAYALITLGIGLSAWVILKRVVRETGVKLSARAAPWILLMLLMSNNVVGQFQTANISLWVLSFTLFALYKHLHGKTLVAAFWLALAVNFKVFPAFMLIYFFWMRDLRFFIYFGLCSLALVLVPALYFGWTENIQLHLQQVEMLRAYGPQNDFGREAYQSLSALLVRLGREGWLGNVAEGKLMKVAQLSIVALSGLFLVLLRPGKLRSERTLSFFFLLAMMGLASPASWINSMGYCYFPIFATVAMFSWGPNSTLRNALGQAKVRLIQVLTILFFGGYALTTQGVVGRTLNDILEKMSVPTYALFALVAAFWIMAFGLKRISSEGFAPVEAPGP